MQSSRPARIDGGRRCVRRGTTTARGFSSTTAPRSCTCSSRRLGSTTTSSACGVKRRLRRNENPNVDEDEAENAREGLPSLRLGVFGDLRFFGGRSRDHHGHLAGQSTGALKLERRPSSSPCRAGTSLPSPAPPRPKSLCTHKAA